MVPIDLVTGASGLLGGNLVRSLASNGRRVRILLRKSSKTFHINDIPGLERVEGDITDPASLRRALTGVENVYHCAAKVTISRKMSESIWRTNVIGTENILEEARQAAIRRLVFCSSVDAIGLSHGQQSSDENTPWNWDALGLETAYARSKYEAQKRVLAAAQNGLEAVVVCPTFMLGAYDPHPSSGQLILSVAQNRVLPGMPGGNNFVDVEDVVTGMQTAAYKGQPGEIYILGNHNLPYQQIFEIIAGVLHKKRISLPVPYCAARLAGWAGDLYEKVSGQEASLNTAMAKLGYIHHYYDATKAVRELNLPQSSLEMAIIRAVNWFKHVGMLAA